MPDEEECPCSWMEKAKAICIVIGALTTSVASVAAAIFGMMNSRNLDDVKSTQGTQVQRAETVQQTLDTQTESTDAKLVKIEKTTAAFRDSMGPQLWSAWKYLEGVADFDPTPDNVAKAKEAKAAYEAYVKKTKNP